jgi:hypothetical protein
MSGPGDEKFLLKKNQYTFSEDGGNCFQAESPKQKNIVGGYFGSLFN